MNLTACRGIEKTLTKVEVPAPCKYVLKLVRPRTQLSAQLSVEIFATDMEAIDHTSGNLNRSKFSIKQNAKIVERN